MMPILGWIVVGFLLGSIPSPYLMALLAGRIDVIKEMRRQDSPHDAHFLVVNRMSKTAGIASIVLDVLKGFVPALVAVLLDASFAQLAWFGVAIVAGHSFAPFLREAGGRGLTAAAGVSLVIIPRAMIATGVISLIGTVTKRGGLGTGIGFSLLPIFAMAFGYERQLVWMSAGIVGLIMIRRLEGIEEDRREGVPLGRAVVARMLFDLPRGGR